MAKYRLVGVREETPAEAARRKWFEKQVLASPDNLEAAARLLVGLVTGLLGLLLGVLTVASDPLPGYLRLPSVRALGVAAVVLLLLGLLAALVVVLPRRVVAASTRPESQAAAFERLLRRKATALAVATAAFGLGLAALGAVLVLALLTATT